MIAQIRLNFLSGDFFNTIAPIRTSTGLLNIDRVSVALLDDLIRLSHQQGGDAESERLRGH